MLTMCFPSASFILNSGVGDGSYWDSNARVICDAF
jgi:hypothetical protein